MNSYINLILDTEGAKERLQRLFQSAPEPEKNAGGSADNKHRCGNVVIPGAQFAAADFLDSRRRSGTDRAWYADLLRLRGVFLATIRADETQIEASFWAATRTAKEKKSISLVARAEASYAEFRGRKGEP